MKETTITQLLGNVKKGKAVLSGVMTVDNLVYPTEVVMGEKKFKVLKINIFENVIVLEKI